MNVKIFNVLKISILFGVIGISQVFANNSYPQTKLINVEVDNATIEQVINIIESQSEYHFLYNKNVVDVEKKVSIQVRNETIFNVLNALFKDGDISYLVSDRQIILNKRLPLSSPEIQQAGKRITGTIVDETGEPVAGANIVEKGSANGNISDIDGRFTLNVSDNATIVVSYVGYVSQEIDVRNQTELKVILKEDSKSLDEIVVIGYGTVKKSDLTGSVSSIKSDELKKLPMTSIDQGIQGKAAGVQVTTTSGAPGGQITIRVRGGNSLTSSNEPLYVIDGFPISAGGMASGFNNSSLGNNSLATINPNDIESIEILKDASAAAIYGSRGANGVVLITTKRGKSGRTKVTYDGYLGTQKVAKVLDFMNGEEFATMSNQAAANAGLAPIYGGTNERWKEPSYYRNNDTDWQSLIFREAMMHSHQVSINGGTDNTQFAVTGNFFSQDGVVLNSDFNRASLRANLDSKVSDWVKIQTSLTATRTFADMTTSESDGSNNSGTINGAISIPPTMPVYNDDGTFTTLNQTPFGVTSSNPYSLALLAKDQSTIDRVLANISIRFDFAKLFDGLALELRGGTDYSNAFRDTYYPSTVYYGQSSDGVAAKSWNRNTSYLNENLLTYQNTFGKHSINAVGGLTLQLFEYMGGQSIVEGFVNDILEDNNMGAASRARSVPTSSRNASAQASWLGRINYGYADRYLLTLTGRADGSSKFGANNKWGFFPSAALAWRVSEEAFMESIKQQISNLKLRISYGLTGNQGFSNYASLASLAQYSYNLGGGIKATGFAPNKIPNSDLKWEKTSTFDVGIDLGFLNNRLNLTVDYYYKKTNDLLWNVTIPLSTGFSSILSNHGTLSNWGIEAALGYDLISNSRGGFTWSTNLMYSLNRNKVLSLPNITPGRTTTLSGHLKLDGSWLEEGYPVGIWKYYLYDGVFETQEMLDATIVNANGETVPKYPKSLTTDGLGSPKFKDLNQDGKIDRDDWTVIGDPNPDFIFSWTNNFTYKNFDLNIFINGSYGNDILNMTRGESAQITPFASQRKSMLNYWTTTNTHTDIPAPRTSPHPNLILSDWMIEDGSYVRLKNIVLGYRFPIKRTIESLRIYLSAQNLITISDYSGYDPEVNSKGQSNLQLGIDWNSYPVSRVLMFGINLAF
ncbi:MAG: TonB-dependent receptor [Tannerella sp.]|jgi:TonB-linked SusC/RagA family outer membrane protein|nr:TonB-dependent receptor [Tannerella sp.]